MPSSIAPSSDKKNGFSLVELSIVLAVLGLLAGAVMVGRSMLRQTQMQTIVSDYTKYSNAVAQFRQQYGGLPGDLIDATNFWGDDATTCADAGVTDGTPGTCNGDGNENMSDSAEPYRAWQHLVLANYISVSVTGVASGGGAVPGTNVPSARIKKTGWSFGYKAATSGNANQYDQDLSNFLAVGGATAADPLTQAATIVPKEAWQLDTKMDNGLPGTGRIVTLKPAVLGSCATSATDATATYNLTSTAAACSLNMSLTLK